MTWNYTVQLHDPNNVGGSANASLVYDLEQALAIWSQYILGIGTLIVDLVIEDTPVGRASAASTSSFFVGTNAQGLNIFEPSSLYELTTGQHVNGTTSDITVTVSPAYFSNLDLDYGLTYNSDVPSNKYNPIVVFLHELMHGFGMAGAYTQTGTLPGNYEFTFDTFVTKTAGGAYFTGANAEAAFGGPVPLTTASTTQNYYHFGNQLSDLSQSPSTVQDPLTLDLMNGIVFFYDYQYQISALDIGVLKDLGYSIRTAPVIAAHDATATHGQSFAASSLFSGSVAAGDTITEYALWSSNGSGHWVVNGVTQSTGVEIDITAAQLAQTTYQSGSGSDQLFARAYDGVLWGDWKAFTVTAPADRAPVVTASGLTASRGQTSIAATSLFSATDADNDAITKYALWDTQGNGHWTVNGTTQGTNTEIDVAAGNLSTVGYVFGSASDTLYVRAFDGYLWGAWTAFTASPFTNHAPVASAADFSATHAQSIAAASLFSASDVDGDAITNYQLWDSTADVASGHWLVGGVAQGANVAIDITAAQLSSTTFQAGGITDDLWVRAYDGTVWSDWKEFHVNPPPDQAPTGFPLNVQGMRGQSSVAATTLIHLSDPDGDAITQYQLWDTEGHGYWAINGTAQATNTAIDVAAADLANTSYIFGSASDTLYVRAFDGWLWSAWKPFVAIPYINHPPVAIAPDFAATHTQNIPASSLVNVADADHDMITNYQLWDSTTDPVSGHWVVGGVAQDANVAVNITLAQLSNTTFQAGLISDDLWVREFDGTFWSDWKEFHVNPPADRAPIVTAPTYNEIFGQFSVPATSLFSASDPDGDAIVKYSLWDGGGGGHWVVNGVAQPEGTEIVITAAQLAQTSFDYGAGGSDSLYVRASDGLLWSPWVPFSMTAPIDDPPAVTPTAQTVSATHNQVFAASSLFTAFDPDSDPVTRYSLWDTEGNGHWIVNGVLQATNAEIIVSAADLANTIYQSGSGTDHLYVRATSWLTWGAWSAFTVTGPADIPPVVTASDVTAAHNQSIAASSLFTVSDTDHDAMTKYHLWDSSTDPSSGHWVVGGVVQGANQTIEISAAQLAGTTFQSGSGSDDLWVQAYDGSAWSAWKEFHVNAPIDHAPVVTASDFTATHNQSIAASSLFSVTDADNDTMSAYQFWDSTSAAASGHFVVGGVAQGAGQTIDVSAAQLSSTTFQSGSGSDDLWVRAFDGSLWSNWQEFHVNAPLNHAPVAAATDLTRAQNSSLAVTSLFSVTDADSDAITAYHFWDSTADPASGHFAIGGIAQGSNQNINVSAAQLAQTSFQTGTVADDLWVQAFDGTEWGAWKEFHIFV